MTKIFRLFKKDKWLIILCFYLIIFQVIHIFLSKFHYSECDSSQVYLTFSSSGIDSFQSSLRNILNTSPKILVLPRYILSILAEIIPFNPIQGALQLPLKMTYPPMAGFIYGFAPIVTFESFNTFNTFFTGILLSATSLLTFLFLDKLLVRKIISFMAGVSITGFYGVNAYSYHLGSTIWFIFSSIAGLYLLTIDSKKMRDIYSSLLILTSYPYILFWFSNLFIDSLNYFLFSLRKFSNTKSFGFKIPVVFKRIFFENKWGFISFFVTVIFFFPFNQGFRSDFDFNGIFTLFSFKPEYNSISILTKGLSLLFIILSLITVLSNTYRFYKQYRDTKECNLNFQQKILTSITLFLFLLLFLVSSKNLTFSTTRHNLFLIPYFLVLSSVGLNQIILYETKAFQLNFIVRTFSLIFTCAILVNSTVNTLTRLDPLKIYGLPDRILSITNQYPLKLSLLDCDVHYIYNDFARKYGKYDLKQPNNLSSLDVLGKKLVVTNGSSEEAKTFLDYVRNHKKNDIFEITERSIKLKLLEEPFSVVNNSYFDTFNFSKSEGYNYNKMSRPNNLYVIPVEVIESENSFYKKATTILDRDPFSYRLIIDFLKKFSLYD